ncbi:hypothetical protein [Aciditerrimonas ferrireducens]|uniref:hypothetical protein n=1 Tax=Aciditerrimonas ferrireducens TaxID=667306 RepID=UPI0020040C83|nr:hypothetical protein [Aciditerrimonas ferrireducens]MCK4176599.1 hypothetical protein [Aciditerrimonas ferrireducens]
MLRPLSWRYPLADTANGDRGLLVAEGAEAEVDLRALRQLTPYGLVAWALVAGHNDRLLVTTRFRLPADPLVQGALARAGLDQLAKELLCPVEGAGSWPPEDPDPAIGRAQSPVAVEVEVPCRPVHGDQERSGLRAELAAWLEGTPRSVAQLALEATEVLLDNQRDHSGAFDAYVAAGTVRGPRERRRLELAVGDSGRGLAGTATDLDEVLARRGPLAGLVEAVLGAGGMAVLRSGTLRRTCWPSGPVDLPLPALRGTLVALAVPLPEAPSSGTGGPVTR